MKLFLFYLFSIVASVPFAAGAAQRAPLLEGLYMGSHVELSPKESKQKFISISQRGDGNQVVYTFREMTAYKDGEKVHIMGPFQYEFAVGEKAVICQGNRLIPDANSFRFDRFSYQVNEAGDLIEEFVEQAFDATIYSEVEAQARTLRKKYSRVRSREIYEEVEAYFTSAMPPTF